MILGVDLGTTYSAAAVMTENGPRLIPNALGEVLTPSVVGVDLDGKLLVGRAALELAIVHPDRCASVFKRHMGSDWTTTLDGKTFSPEQLSAFVLASLKQDAEVHRGVPVERAVITVPAYFNEHQRKATLRAGQMAGLTVERILNEPTAAAIAYGLSEAEDQRVAVVFDLGGGTFDISVVEQFEGMLEVQSSSGETFLGGEDFTTAMVARILESQGYVYERAEHEHRQMVARLRAECERAKRRLSRESHVTVRVPNEGGTFSPDAPTIEISRQQMEGWTESVLARVELPVRRALGDAGLKRADVDEVILVGGATRMPAVLERVEAMFGRQPRCSLNPDEVVALGAAVQAGL
ncbi:MAG: Hsp70 family protein, partial [Planctomycetes bacterium]|nr:Hsp70 family protein [Planctomycetota bacterium]